MIICPYVQTYSTPGVESWDVIKIALAQECSVISMHGNNDIHKHIGFYVGNGKAVSTSSKHNHPIEHGWTFTNRKIELVFWNPKLKL